MKSIYSFTVHTTEEVQEKTKEKRKNKKTGVEEEVEVSKKIQKKVPHEIVLKQPSRRQLEEADMEYSIEISRCIKKGVLTKAMLAKKYSDTGGILTEKDAQRLVDLTGEGFRRLNHVQNLVVFHLEQHARAGRRRHRGGLLARQYQMP